MIIKKLKGIKNVADPNYWASKIGEKSGLYDKARNSKTRQWVDSLAIRLLDDQGPKLAFCPASRCCLW